MPIDSALIGALHIQYLQRQDLPGAVSPHHALFQTSTIDALLDGHYDGDVSVAELQARGDFGLGTVDALDGEMIALDGAFYQVKADGRAYPVDPRLNTPFAVVTFFEPDLHRTLPPALDLAGLCAFIDRVVGDVAMCHAVRVDGQFHAVTTRSVPKQQQPYLPLVEVVQHQPTFELRDVRGSLVGFRFPQAVQGLNVAGYHLHFITEDRSAGGHVLACQVAHGELRVDHEAAVWLELPAGFAQGSPDTTPAKAEILNRVETASRSG